MHNAIIKLYNMHIIFISYHYLAIICNICNILFAYQEINKYRLLKIAAFRLRERSGILK
jgi:hypothetical protein